LVYCRYARRDPYAKHFIEFGLLHHFDACHFEWNADGRSRMVFGWDGESESPDRISREVGDGRLRIKSGCERCQVSLRSAKASLRGK
jgi:hypothetical protein